MTHSARQTLQSNISTNLKQNSKIVEVVNLGPRCNRLTKKAEGRKSRETVFLRFSAPRCTVGFGDFGTLTQFKLI
jgi:hypothetical protein